MLVLVCDGTSFGCVTIKDLRAPAVANILQGQRTMPEGG
jgi:hypothetical protein